MAEAEELTIERGQVYGHPLVNFTRIADMTRPLIDCQDEVVAHALYMILVKVARLIETPDHQDSIDDIKGYVRTIEMIHEARKR